MRTTNRKADRTRIRLRAVYVLVNLTLIILGGVLAAPIVILFTLLAVPDVLTLLPTALLYFNLLVAPLLFLKGGPLRHAGIAATLCAAVALIPGGYSRLRVAAIGVRLRWNTAVEPAGAPARRIALRYDHGPDRPSFEEEVCGRACRELLLSDAVDSITITTTDSSVPRSTTFISARGPACARTEVTSGEARCVIPRFDDVATPEFTLVATPYRPPNGGTTCGAEPTLIGGWSVTGSLREPGGTSRIVYSKDEERLWPVALPYRVGSHFTHGTDGFFYGSACDAPITVNPLTMRSVFEDLGYRARTDIPQQEGPAAGALRPTDENRLQAVLSQPGPAAFDRVQNGFVEAWAGHLDLRSPYPPEIIATVRRLIHDPRLGSISYLTRILTRPEVAAALFDDMVEICRSLPKDAKNPSTGETVGDALAYISASLKLGHDTTLGSLAAAETTCTRTYAQRVRHAEGSARERETRARERATERR